MRFVADLPSPTEFQVVTRGDPYSVTVEFAGVRAPAELQTGRAGVNMVSLYHFENGGEGQARAVLDLNGPVRVRQATLFPATGGQPFDLEIRLRRPDGAHSTTVIVSHQPSTIEKFCNRAAILRDGRLYLFETLDEAKQYYDYTS